MSLIEFLISLLEFNWSGIKFVWLKPASHSFHELIIICLAAIFSISAYSFPLINSLQQHSFFAATPFHYLTSLCIQSTNSWLLYFRNWSLSFGNQKARNEMISEWWMKKEWMYSGNARKNERISACWIMSDRLRQKDWMNGAKCNLINSV